ncbi:MAG: hypothetical protein ABI262_12430 [Microcoleus sp.]
METSANLAAIGNAGIGWVVNFRRSRTAIAFLRNARFQSAINY